MTDIQKAPPANFFFAKCASYAERTSLLNQQTNIHEKKKGTEYRRARAKEIADSLKLNHRSRTYHHETRMGTAPAIGHGFLRVCSSFKDARHIIDSENHQIQAREQRRPMHPSKPALSYCRHDGLRRACYDKHSTAIQAYGERRTSVSNWRSDQNHCDFIHGRYIPPS